MEVIQGKKRKKNIKKEIEIGIGIEDINKVAQDQDIEALALNNHILLLDRMEE